MDPLLYDAIVEALRILFLICVPVLLTAAAAGTLAAVLQSITNIHEPALSYALRLLAVVGVFYFIYPEVASSLQRLSLMVYQ